MKYERYVLVLGAGNGQVPLMELAHQRGLGVLAVSPKGNYPGLAIADRVVDEDMRYPDRIWRHQELRELRIVAIVSDQVDVAVPSVAILAQRLGLKGNSVDVANRFKNKFLMRRAAEQLGIDVPKYALIRCESEIEQVVRDFSFPLMMKPVDSAASRGVYKVSTIDELRMCFPKSLQYALQGVIVEEFVEGREYVVEGFTSEGTTSNLIVGHRDYFNVPGTFIPCATVFRDADSATEQLEERLKKINIRLVEGLGLDFGITHAEFLYQESTDRVFLVEVAARGGGVCISSDLIPGACGFNAVESYFRVALGEKLPPIKLRKGAAAYFCYMLPEGEVCSIEGVSEMEKISGFRRAVLNNVWPGLKIGVANDKSSRKGPILVQGETKEECYRIIEKIKGVFSVCVQTQRGVMPEYWS